MKILFVIPLLIALDIYLRLHAEQVVAWIEKHIVCDGWEDGEGFHRGRQE